MLLSDLVLTPLCLGGLAFGLEGTLLVEGVHILQGASLRSQEGRTGLRGV